MSYQPLALKYRPQKWSDLIGQEVMVQTITNMLKVNELATSLVFGGSRGVGKTTTARIVARAVNCEALDKETQEPCCECHSCVDILEERSFAYQEMDAASNGLVDDVRRIKEELRYADTSTKKRVYCLDEAHGLTDKAWQAFLKLLEEPPPNTVFIFCTTETHKIPETIISRSMDFTFLRMTNVHIVQRLQYICHKEAIAFEDGVLNDIARHVNGGMRDAISLLDQLRSYAMGQPIGRKHVAYVIGAVNTELLFKLVDACFKVDTAGVYRLLQQAYTEISDIGTLIQNLMEFYRELLLAKVGVPQVDVQPEHLKNLQLFGGALPLDYIVACQTELANIHDQLRRSQLPGRSVVDINIPKLFFGGLGRTAAPMIQAPVTTQAVVQEVLSPEALLTALGPGCTILQM